MIAILGERIVEAYCAFCCHGATVRRCARRCRRTRVTGMIPRASASFKCCYLEPLTFVRLLDGTDTTTYLEECAEGRGDEDKAPDN